MKKINEKLKHVKSGMLSLESVIGLLLFIVLLAILLDMLTLSNRYMSIHDTAKELARTMAVQGGALERIPDGYPNNYYNSTDLANLVDKSMKISGFSGNDYRVYVSYSKYESDNTGKVISDDTYNKDFMVVRDGVMTVQETDQIDYLNDFTVTIVGKYDWVFSKLSLGLPAANLKISAPGVSEWKYDYDHWESE